VSGRPTLPFLQPSPSLSNQRFTTEAHRYGEDGRNEENDQRLPPCLCGEKRFFSNTKLYVSFAVIEIFAFSTFDTGQPFSAASAYF
jgi:hypothetical protein